MDEALEDFNPLATGKLTGTPPLTNVGSGLKPAAGTSPPWFWAGCRLLRRGAAWHGECAFPPLSRSAPAPARLRAGRGRSPASPLGGQERAMGRQARIKCALQSVRADLGEI